MTEREIYEALVRSNRYSTYGYFPSTRYNNRKDLETMDFNKTSIVVDGHTFPTYGIEVDSDYSGTRITASAYLSPDMKCAKSTKPTKLSITNVIFNPPATIVFWSDHTKTVVKCDISLEKYDPEKGLAMAISRKMLGDNKREYYNTFLHWLKKYDKQPEEETTTVTVEVDGKEFTNVISEAIVKENKRRNRRVMF